MLQEALSFLKYYKRRSKSLKSVMIFIIICLVLSAGFRRRIVQPKVPAQVLSNVVYDHHSFIINGKRQLLIAGAIHYPRSSPGMWPYLFKKTKEAGINTIDTYVFWNLHEPVEGHYDFETGKIYLLRSRICKLTAVSETCARARTVRSPKNR
jgi:hypothetical protein